MYLARKTLWMTCRFNRPAALETGEYQTILEDAEKWGTSQEPWAQALKERLSLGVYPAPKPLTFPQRMGKRIKHFLYYKKEDAASVRIKILGLRIYKRKKEGPLHQSRE